MLTIEELIVQSLYHKLVFVNVKRTAVPPKEEKSGEETGVTNEDTENLAAAGGDVGTAVDPTTTTIDGLGQLFLESLRSASEAAAGHDSTGLNLPAHPGGDNHKGQTLVSMPNVQLKSGTETQTDFAPVWSIDSNLLSGPQLPLPDDILEQLRGSGMQLVNPEQLATQSLDLTECQQFTIVHYQDKRDPNKKAFFMVKSDQQGPALLTAQDLLQDSLATIEEANYESDSPEHSSKLNKTPVHSTLSKSSNQSSRISGNKPIIHSSPTRNGNDQGSKVLIPNGDVFHHSECDGSFDSSFEDRGNIPSITYTTDDDSNDCAADSAETAPSGTSTPKISYRRVDVSQTGSVVKEIKEMDLKEIKEMNRRSLSYIVSDGTDVAKSHFLKDGDEHASLTYEPNTRQPKKKAEANGGLNQLCRMGSMPRPNAVPKFSPSREGRIRKTQRCQASNESLEFGNDSFSGSEDGMFSLASFSKNMSISSSASDGDCSLHEDWMALLPDKLHQVPVTFLAIPGSHCCVGIEDDMRTDLDFVPVSSELAEFLHRMPHYSVFNSFRFLMKRLWRAWMPRQALSVIDQLRAGSRYLDFRVIRNKGALLGHSGLHTRPIKNYLREVAGFMEEHPRELVIVHWPDVSSLESRDKRSLLTLIYQSLGSRLCRHAEAAPLSKLTLAHLWKLQKQVIVVFPQNDLTELNDHIFAGVLWSDKEFELLMTPVKKQKDFIEYLDASYLPQTSLDKFRLTQAVLTPDPTLMFGEHKYKSLKQLTRHETCPALKNWLDSKQGLNIVAVDFVGFGEIVNEIICLNTLKKPLA